MLFLATREDTDFFYIGAEDAPQNRVAEGSGAHRNHQNLVFKDEGIIIQKNFQQFCSSS